MAVNWLLSALILLSRLFYGAFADLMNVTIDDTYGDPYTGLVPTYQNCSQGSQCSDCSDTTFLNSGYVYEGDWHDCAPGSSIEFSFKGQAFYLFAAYDTVLEVSATIFLDGKQVGQYNVPDLQGGQGVLYNQTLFQMDNIGDGRHTVHIQNDKYLLFDYAVYSTTETPNKDTLRTGSGSKKKIIAIVIPVVAAFILAAISAYLVRRRYRRRRGGIKVGSRNEKGILEEGVSPSTVQETLSQGPNGLTLSYAAPHPESVSHEGALGGAPSTVSPHTDLPSSGMAMAALESAPAEGTGVAERSSAQSPSSTRTETKAGIQRQIAQLEKQQAEAARAQQAQARATAQAPGPSDRNREMEAQAAAMSTQMAILQRQMDELNARLRGDVYEAPPQYERGG